MVERSVPPSSTRDHRERRAVRRPHGRVRRCSRVDLLEVDAFVRVPDRPDEVHAGHTDGSEQLDVRRRRDRRHVLFERHQVSERFSARCRGPAVEHLSAGQVRHEHRGHEQHHEQARRDRATHGTPAVARDPARCHALSSAPPIGGLSSVLVPTRTTANDRGRSAPPGADRSGVGQSWAVSAARRSIRCRMMRPSAGLRVRVGRVRYLLQHGVADRNNRCIRSSPVHRKDAFRW
jgi:hypothetical protein